MSLAQNLNFNKRKEKTNTSPLSQSNTITIDKNITSGNHTQNHKINKTNYQKINVKKFNKYRLGISSGYSYQPYILKANKNQDYEEHNKKLASRNHITLDANYFFYPDFEIGIKNNNFTSITSTNNIYWEDTNNYTHIGLMKDNTKITFYDLTFFNKKVINAKNENSTGITFGQFNYNNKGIFIKEYLVTANIIGVIYDLGYQRILSENFTRNPQASLSSPNYKNHKIVTDPLIKTSRNNWSHEYRIKKFNSSIRNIYR